MAGVPEETRGQIIDLALNEPELSPRELAVIFTDTKGQFVSESSVYRLLKAHDLIISPAFIVIKAADEFHDKTTAPNQLWHGSNCAVDGSASVNDHVEPFFRQQEGRNSS